MNKSEKQRARRAEDTERQRAMRATRRHLEDLRRAYRSPPEDVRVKSLGVATYFEPAPPSSYRSSPSQLCSELGE